MKWNPFFAVFRIETSFWDVDVDMDVSKILIKAFLPFREMIEQRVYLSLIDTKIALRSKSTVAFRVGGRGAFGSDSGGRTNQDDDVIYLPSLRRFSRRTG